MFLDQNKKAASRGETKDVHPGEIIYTLYA